MSQSPSCWGDISWETWGKWRLCDNPNSLEEPMTCEDQEDPIVNITTDSLSASLQNAHICASLVAVDLGKLCWHASTRNYEEKSVGWGGYENFSQPGIQHSLHYCHISSPNTPWREPRCFSSYKKKPAVWNSQNNSWRLFISILFYPYLHAVKLFSSQLVMHSICSKLFFYGVVITFSTLLQAEISFICSDQPKTPQ